MATKGRRRWNDPIVYFESLGVWTSGNHNPNTLATSDSGERRLYSIGAFDLNARLYCVTSDGS